MKVNIQFILDRANGTNAAALAIMADWEWAEKPVVQMQADTLALATQAGISDTAEHALVNATNQKNAAFTSYHLNTVALLGMTRTHYRKNPAALATLGNLHAKGQSDQSILDEGLAFATVWLQLDATYVPDTAWTLAAYEAAGTATAAKGVALITANVAWSNQSAETDALGLAVEDTNTAWYADATKKYGPDTPHGVMIRQTVPTTSATVNPPLAPVVLEAQALGGGTVHIDFQPPASGWIQVLHQGPGETAFTVANNKLTADFWEQGGFAPGAHSFKFVGVNTGGVGGTSAPIVIQVT